MAPPHQDQQLEKLVDEVLKKNNSRELENFLQDEVKEGDNIKCSKQFLTKIDKLINRGLDRRDAKYGCLGFTVLQKCGKNLSLPGGQGFAGMVTQGLVKKMVQWFVKSRQLWIDGGQQRDEALIILAEDFFDLLMIVHGVSKEGMCQITESLLYPIGQLAADPRIHIMIQKEAIRKLNIILDKIPAELKKEKRILSSQEASDIMNTLAGRILDGGDYDLQIALMEALCRMTTRSHRKEMADRWFTMEYVACAFNKIQDSEFETDCRKFLNLINGMQGEKRRVFSYPCLEVYLDKHELLMPSDDKLEDFWIDFNLGSQSISFYFSMADDNAEEVQWDTIFIPENEVECFAVTEESRRLVLRLRLSEPVSVSGVEGSNLTIYFSTSLDILQAACQVYGLNKNKCFVGKSGTSVVKTTVNIIMESGSQAIVPESQASTIDDIDRQRNDSSCLLPPPPAPAQMVTPARRRVSESCTFITSSGTGSRSGTSPFTLVKQATTPGLSKMKPALEMIRSCERQAQPTLGQLRTSTKSSSASTLAPDKIEKDAFLQSKDSKQGARAVVEKYRRNIPVDKVVEMLQADQEEEEEPLDQSFVPDSQPTTRTEKLSHWTKMSVSEMLIPVQRSFHKDPSKPEPFPSVVRQDQNSTTQRALTPGSCPINQQHLHTQLTQRLQEVLKERNNSNGSVERGRACGHSRFQSRGSEERCRETGLASPETQGQEIRQGRAKKKSYTVNSCGSESVLFKDTKKPTLTKGLKERPTPNSNVQVGGSMSSKEKRDAEVAGSMVKLISSRYDSNKTSTSKTTVQNIHARWAPPVINRSLFDRSWLPSTKKGTTEAPEFTKPDSSSKKPSVLHREDVFAFSADTPVNIRGMAKKSLETSATESSAIHDSWAIPSTLKKDLPTGKKKRHVKKHLFSDTDTDAAMTDVSWLAASSRRPKPKVTDYTRQPPVKSKAPETDESLNLPLLSPKPVKEKTKPTKKLRAKEKMEKPAAALGPKREAVIPRKAVPGQGKTAPIQRKELDLSKAALGQGRRPQRAAAATTKSYREPDSDDSQAESETEQPPRPKKRSISKLETSDNTIYQEATEWKNNKMAPAKKQINVLKNSWAARLGSFSPSTPPIEKLRSAERSVAVAVSPLLSPMGALPASPIGSDPPSPILDLPKRSTTSSGKGGFQPSSFYSINKKSDTVKHPDLPSVPCLPFMPSLPSPLTLSPKSPNPVLPTAKKPSAVEPQLSPISWPISPAQSLFSQCSQPVLTSTALEKSLLPSLQSQFSQTAGDTLNRSLHFGSDRESLVSRVTLSQSSSKSVMSTTKVEISSTALAMANKLEKTPASNIGPKPDQQDYHLSGPSRKRCNTPSSSNSEGEIDEQGTVDEEDKKGKQSTGLYAKMRPRKLFKSMAKSAQVQNLKENSSSDEKDANNEGNSGRGAISGPSKATQKGYNLIQRESMSAQESVIDVSPEGEVSRMVSSHRVSSSHWEADVEGERDMELPDIGPTPQDMGAMCRQFSTELKRKFQNRCRQMELYNKQSLKTVQQHVSSISLQVSQCRSQKLEQVRSILMKEINNLEQDESTLKNMEKECIAYWRKQSLGFRSCQEGEIKRLQTLKSAFQNNKCHSLEYEERIFTSQMCLMRKDMKSVQDRLFKEMQEEEILSVRRGLHTLFLPDGPRF